MAFDFLVRAFFSDSGLSAGLEKANDQLKQLKRSGPDAGQGVRAVEQGVRMLAFQAAGVPGPLGRVASGILQIGGGSALMVGAVAGLALVGMAIRALTKDARDNAEAQKNMQDQIAKLGPSGVAHAARLKIADLIQERDNPTIVQRFKRAPLFSGPRIGGGWRPEELEQINREIAEQQNIINDAMKDFVDVATRAKQDAALEMRQAIDRSKMRGSIMPGGELASDLDLRQRARQNELQANPHTRDVAIQVAAEERRAAAINLSTDAQQDSIQAAAEATVRNRMLWSSEQDVTEALQVEQGVRRGLDRVVAQNIAARDKETAANLKAVNVLRTQLPAAFAAMGAAAADSMQAVVQSAVQSVTQIAQALPGVTPIESSVIGFVGGLLGGLFGRSRPLPVEVTNTADLRPEGIDRFTLQILSSSTGEMMDEIVYELGRRTRLDRVIRIPRGVLIRAGG